jgi:hypothetical protein
MVEIKFFISVYLISFAIFVFVLIFKHGEVGLVATLRNVMVLDGLQNGTARLMGMGAIRKTAILGEMEDFLEVAGQLLTLHIEGTKALDSWSVDEVAITYSDHL